MYLNSNLTPNFRFVQPAVLHVHLNMWYASSISDHLPMIKETKGLRAICALQKVSSPSLTGAHIEVLTEYSLPMLNTPGCIKSQLNPNYHFTNTLLLCDIRVDWQ